MTGTTVIFELITILKQKQTEVMQGSILPVTIPPGHTPGDLQFFSYLAVFSPPRARRKRQFPSPGTPHRPQIRCFVFKIDFRAIAQPDVLTRT